MNRTSRWIGLAVFVAACLGAGSLGAIATTPEIDGWYRTLAKPDWNPPVKQTVVLSDVIAPSGLPGHVRGM